MAAALFTALQLWLSGTTRLEIVVPSMLGVQRMLQQWENKDRDTLALWEKMNGWVYDGFRETYSYLNILTILLLLTLIRRKTHYM